MATATVTPVSQIQAIAAARPANGSEAEGSSSFAQALEARRPAAKADQANPAQSRRNEGSAQDKRDAAAAAGAEPPAEQAAPEAAPTTNNPALDVLLAEDENASDDGGAELLALASGAEPAANPASAPAILAAATGGQERLQANLDADAEAPLTELSTRGTREDSSARSDARGMAPADNAEVATLGDEGSSRAPAARSESQGGFSEALANAHAQAGMKPGEAIHDPGARHTVATPVASRGWADEVGQKLVWTASQDNGIAELILTPPQLGRIQISINLQGDQASASFIAANPLTREALQDAMPRLREILAQSGIQLGQADVGAGNNPQAQDQQSPGMRSLSSLQRLNGGEADVPLFASHGAVVSAQGGRSMIDIFA